MRLKKVVAIVVLLVGTSLTASARVGVGVVVGTAPPAPVLAAGAVGVAAGPGYVWGDGYWDFVGGGWVWVPGRWVLPPRPGAVWVRGYVRPFGDRFHYYRGHWR